MADADIPSVKQPEARSKRRWAKRFGWFLAALLVPLALAAAFLSSPFGKRFVTDQIAQVAPASGLRFQVGRIEGDIYGQAVLRDVVLSDPQGEFLVIPEVQIDWRPLAWLWSGIDVRNLAARRGRLERLPELLPGDPDAPILPDFDIRVDQFLIEDLIIAPGVAGDRAHTIQFASEIDIRSGRVLLDADGAFGAEDRLALLLDAEPDGDRFDLSLDYSASADGPIAAAIGLESGYQARIEGDGTWSRWLGHALVIRRQGDAGGAQERFAAFQITNKSGQYGVIGQVRPRLDDATLLGRATRDNVSFVLSGTLEQSTFDGEMTAISSALDMRGTGAVDLARNRFDDFVVQASLRDPDLFGDAAQMQAVQLAAALDGPFRDLTIAHDLTVGELNAGAIAFENLAQNGTATFDGAVLRVPLSVTVDRVLTGADTLDTRLTNGTLSGQLIYGGSRLNADNARLRFPETAAELTLRGDLARGVYTLAGPVTARNFALDNIGTINADANLVAQFGNAVAWSVSADLAGQLGDVTNESIAALVGRDMEFAGSFSSGANQPVIVRDASVKSLLLDADFTSQIVDGRTKLTGDGRHSEYGAFTIDAEIAGEGPSVALVLADPLPAAGLKDVRLALAPSNDGFALDTSGLSLLGPFDGALGLTLPADGGPARLTVNRLRISDTDTSGNLILGKGAVTGNLTFSGGGLDGTLALLPARDSGQGFDLSATAQRARFDGDAPIRLAKADIAARGSFRDGKSRVLANISGSGLEYGALSVAQFAAESEIVDGSGIVKASIAGRRSDRFALKLNGDIAPDRISVLARGEYGGQAITMPRRALFTPLAEGGWSLAPTQLGYADGFAIVEGTLGAGQTRMKAQISRLPLRIADLAGAELGLGGRLSGIVDWEQSGSGKPSAKARVQIENFSRSGLILSSTPIDVLGTAELTPSSLRIAARLRDDDTPLGRLNADISRFGDGGDWFDQIANGRLNAQLAYDGSASSLWRLAAIETFDLTGPLKINASASGSLANPRIRGNLASDDLRVQSAISGTDIRDVSARGQFEGSRLELTRFAGVTRGNGTISGSGTIDFAQISPGRGPQLDLRAAAKDARLLNANGLDATMTGPLRIVSNGAGGTIAGRVTIDQASWELGIADEDQSLPRIATREINQLDSSAAVTNGAGSSWRYLINASAARRVAVDGLGLDSEWAVDIALRGTVNDPRIGGQARLVRGDYTFAGTRFDLTQGRIIFDANGPIDPRLDLAAETNVSGTDVNVSITGNAQSPQVAFSSEPTLPEEEILARLLFGGSVTSLSATDAVQLGAALAALRGGEGGLDPIGQLRRSVGLDQLRIVSADPALGRETGVALGKNIGRRVYVEIVTDGRGYSATSVEYRVTRWLALLGTVSTIGRDSILAEISRDY